MKKLKQEFPNNFELVYTNLLPDSIIKSYRETKSINKLLTNLIINNFSNYITYSDLNSKVYYSILFKKIIDSLPDYLKNYIIFSTPDYFLFPDISIDTNIYNSLFNIFHKNNADIINFIENLEEISYKADSLTLNLLLNRDSYIRNSSEVFSNKFIALFKDNKSEITKNTKLFKNFMRLFEASLYSIPNSSVFLSDIPIEIINNIESIELYKNKFLYDEYINGLYLLNIEHKNLINSDVLNKLNIQ